MKILKVAGEQFFEWNNQVIVPRSECSSLGGVLAGIHSSEENDFIFSLIRIHAPYYGPTWIGASAISDYVWEWDDSTPWDFQNWDEGKMQFDDKKRTWIECLFVKYS